ncbi:MAG: amidohydrolase family protein [Chloroflexota bacterium]|nr:amidohydrolase family protein [Chloroflexota bacterium]
MIIDSHVHVYPPSFRERREEIALRDATFRELYANPDAVLVTADDLLAAMDETGVDVAVAVGIGWADRDVAREANDYLAGCVARSGGRLLAFGSVNPAWGDDALAEVERCATAGLAGIGELHPDTQGFGIDDAKVMGPLMATAKRLGLPVLTHASEPVGHSYAGKGTVTPDKLLRFIEAFPGQTVIAAHWGGGLPFYALMPEVKAALADTYFDTAASPFLYTPDIFPTAVRVVGAERVLFGTDYPLIKHSRLLAQVRDSGLPDDEQALITGGNAARLFGLGG